MLASHAALLKRVLDGSNPGIDTTTANGDLVVDLPDDCNGVIIEPKPTTGTSFSGNLLLKQANPDTGVALSTVVPTILVYATAGGSFLLTCTAANKIRLTYFRVDNGF
jgi:hypothetical protein